jgi:predicted oxidoreductase (fatty acid repression mutant protein)
MLEEVVAYRKREQMLIQRITVLQGIHSSDVWKSYTELIGDSIAHIEKKMLDESKKKELNSPEIYRLQGQLEFAKRNDIEKLIGQYQKELQAIKQKLQTYGR